MQDIWILVDAWKPSLNTFQLRSKKHQPQTYRMNVRSLEENLRKKWRRPPYDSAWPGLLTAELKNRDTNEQEFKSDSEDRLWM